MEPRGSVVRRAGMLGRHVGRTRRLVAAGLAIGAVLAACTGQSTASPSVGLAGRASDTQGAFRLTFELPKTTFRAGEPIEGRATLAVIGGAGVPFGSSGGGPFVFTFAEIGGTRNVGGAMTADCAPYRLEPGRPLTSPITKSGGYSGDDPNDAFYSAFLADPVVSLPAGDWRITAGATLVEGEGCSGASRNLSAPITVHVTP
jgi:hypothetical protein